MADPKPTKPQPPIKASMEDLDGVARIDDRWTESKLIQAGYEYTGERPCRDCKAVVYFYKKETGRHGGGAHWLVLDEGTYVPHVCHR